jgi:antitoxin component of RelBE/YafQ-DinJ toxin-antitoxin module
MHQGETLEKRVLVRVDEDLLEQLTEMFPETKGLTYTARTNLFLQKLLEVNKNERRTN